MLLNSNERSQLEHKQIHVSFKDLPIFNMVHPVRLYH